MSKDTPTSGRALIADLLQKFKETAPDLKLIFHEGLSDELWQLAVDGALDAAFCYDPTESEAMRITPLYREDLLLVGPPDVLNPAIEMVNFGSLDRIPLVLGYTHHRTRQFIDSAARAAGVNLESVIEVEPRTLKREVLIRHRRCSIVPYGLFWDEIKSGKLVAQRITPTLSRTVAILVNANLSRSAERFLLATILSLVRARIEENELGWRPI